jgi:hypothetical protein
MRRLGVLPSLVLFCSSGPLRAQKLSVQPSEITAGQSATLFWQTADMPGFLLGFGKVVKGNGSAEVNPGSSTDFILVTQNPIGFNYQTIHLSVRGARGDDGYPSIKEFDDPVQGFHPGKNYTHYLETVWTALQKQGYSVRGDYAPSRPYITASTNFELRPDLVTKQDQIRARRLAIAVDIYEPQGNKIKVDVHPKLEFQYFGEDDWRPEKGSKLAREEAQKVFASLGTAP